MVNRMAKKALKVQDLQSYKDGQGKKEKAVKKRRKMLRELRAAFEGKKFADLSAEEKDGLLKALAIKAKLIEE